MLGRRHLHGVIFFPRWVEEHAERTICYQNEHLEQMRSYRDQGPIYPIYVVPEFARFTLYYVGADDESIIPVAAGDVPAGWADRTN